MENIFAVITIDVIDSKKSNKEIRKFLIEKDIECEEENILNIFLETQAQESSLILDNEGLILTKVCASRGDEIQVVCSNINNICYVTRKLRYYFRPLKLRVGIGIGEISTEINENSWDMNGEAFFRAREALDTVKKEEKLRRTYIVSPDDHLDFIINSIYMLMDSIISEWSIPKWEAIHAYEKYNNYEKAGEYLKKTRQAVSNSCKSAHFDKIKQSEKDIKRLIEYHLDYKGVSCGNFTNYNTNNIG